MKKVEWSDLGQYTSELKHARVISVKGRDMLTLDDPSPN